MMKANKKKGLKIFSIIIGVIIISFLILLSVFNITYIKTKVNGASMYPTLNSDLGGGKDRIYINRFNKGTRGDIVVANIESEPNWDHTLEGKYIIKRLIAKGGDKVKIEKNDDEYTLFVNGEIFYKKQYSGGVPSFIAYEKYIEDNKIDSSRITEENEINIYEGEIFLMGDNWLSSYDSTTVGPLSKSSLVGRVDIVVPQSGNLIWGTIKGVAKTVFG